MQFLESSFTWDPTDTDTYGLAEKYGMSPEERKDSLSNLAGFLPHSYLTSKLKATTKSLSDCWNIIEEHYNVKVSSETVLDFEAIKKIQLKITDSCTKDFFSTVSWYFQKHYRGQTKY